MLSKQRSGGAEVWTTDRGEARVHLPAPTVIVVQVRGHSSMELFPLYVKELESCFRRGHTVHWFADYSAMTSYDSIVRKALSDFTNQNSDRIETMAALFRSKLVAMGIAVANLAIGGKIQAFSSERDYQKKLDETVRSVRARMHGGDAVAP